MADLEPASPAPDPGAIRWRFEARPLAYEPWLALQKRMIARAMPPRPGFGRLSLTWLATAILVAAALVAQDRFLGLTAWLSLGATRRDWYVDLEGLGVLAFAVALFLAGYFVAGLLFTRLRSKLMRRFHGASLSLAAPSELLICEKGVERRGPEGRIFGRWSAVTDDFTAGGVWFLVVDNGFALWIEETALADQRDHVQAFVRARRAVASERERRT